jgi:hypothetical protein
MEAPRYFVGVAARDAVDAAIRIGYIEINRGKAAPLERMRDGDLVLYYSPRVTDGGAPLQEFTALARVRGDALYQAPNVITGTANAATTDTDAAAGGPFRRPADYLDVRAVPIRPLIDTLAFIRNKVHWGAALRFGFVRISPADFALITGAMGVELRPAAAAPA